MAKQPKPTVPFDPKKFSFAIIRQRNSPNEATLSDGFVVRRQEKIYFETFGRYVICASDDQHFVYVDPVKKIGRWSPMCTCGSAAAVLGYNAYKDYASPSSSKGDTIAGEMVVCLAYAQAGKHADGSH
jgi:hypothetical protein